MKIDTSKTLEQLESDIWIEPEFKSNVVLECYRLRKIPIGHFTVENLRIMISQNIGLQYLIPFAIIELQKDILAEGDYYEGDLLTAVARIHADFWTQYPDLKEKLRTLINNNRQLIQHTLPNLDITIFS